MTDNWKYNFDSDQYPNKIQKPVRVSTFFIYDNTFEGLLTAVFDAYNRKQFPEKIVTPNTTIPLFTDTFTVITDDEKSGRVLNGLRTKLSKSALEMLFICFLSEMEDVEMHIFNYIQKAFVAQKSIELNFADPDVLALSKIYRKVQKEEEKMRQFIRFQKTSDGIFFACIEPMYNVLPLSAPFFEDRFADQQWLIYDVKRKYALFYDLKKTEEVYFENLQVNIHTGRLAEDQLDADEIDFQELWKQYFKSASIKERKNLKLQRQHMPKRFWKYLTEKS